jgi:hypothetical protein
VLHILNGDATLDRLQPCDVPGEFLTWGDMLMEGPVVNWLTRAEDWRVRADYLQARFDIPSEPYLQRIAQCHTALADFARHDEVVLWFEEDWFCQIHLVYLLAWFARRSLGPVRLSCVCPPEPLGSTEPERLRALFAQRETVTVSRTAIACQAWAAYADPDPTALGRLRAADLSGWPRLGQGVGCHLRRFPSTRNGASAIEQEILREIAEGPLGFHPLFRGVTAASEIAAYGIGDVQFAGYLRELAPRLITIQAERAPGDLHDRSRPFEAWILEITASGREVLAGRLDLVAIQPLDRWLGGVRLSGHGSAWRWDSERNALVGDRADRG